MAYDLKQIANELKLTALNEAYYGNALYVAMDFDFLSKDKKDVLNRFLCGTALIKDYLILSQIAEDCYDKAKAQ